MLLGKTAKKKKKKELSSMSSYQLAVDYLWTPWNINSKLLASNYVFKVDRKFFE